MSDGEGSDADRVSLCSTIASTTSLTARLEDLTLNFKEKFRRVHQEPPLYEGEEVDDDEEEIVEISEEQLMQELDGMEPSLQVTFPSLQLIHSWLWLHTALKGLHSLSDGRLSDRRSGQPYSESSFSDHAGLC